MPIWVIGGANNALSIEGVVLKGVDVGDVQPDYRLENGGVTICMIWVELGELVSGVRIAAQQQGERHKDSRLYWGWV